MAVKPIRIGIVGAGANTRERHIPGFRALPGVEIVGLVNRTPESTAKVASEFAIPKTYSTWQELVRDPQIDAVCIGTWPNLHCDVTCAALEAGKHVLTEARMARDLAEARKMVAAAQAHPSLVAQVVPSPFGLMPHSFIRALIDESYIGELREVVVIGADDLFWDESKPIHWRQDVAISGKNVLAMGILHETVSRWIPAPKRVFAQSAIFEPQRPHPVTSDKIDIKIPESLQIVTEIAGGARGLYHLSGSILFGPGKQIHLYGRKGTIKYLITPEEQVWVGRLGDKELRLAEIPPEKRGGWRVEAEFVGAIRGEEPVRFTDFPTALRYMEFTEAVSQSVTTGSPVSLPIER